MTEEEFLQIYLNVSPAPVLFYRAYYNDQGWVEVYTMEDLPGNYIEVDQSTYHLSPRARVVNGKLVPIVNSVDVAKLLPSDQGVGCDPRDVCVVTNNQSSTKWSLKINEQN